MSSNWRSRDPLPPLSAFDNPGKTSLPPPPDRAPVGICMAMCSEREIKEREDFRELSRMEVLPGAVRADGLPRADAARAVKRYHRPAAGAPPPPPSELRPLGVLRRTVEHLLRVWTENPDEAPLTRYLFIADRLRAVVQDLTVQRLHCDAIFGRIARFHAWAELAFCRVPPSQGFSAAQNRDQLCNALISLLHAPPPPPPAAKGAAAAAAAARGECWGYLLLLHADQPHEFQAELARAPPDVRGDPAVHRALRVAGAVGCADGAALARALRAAPPLVVGCALRLLPRARAAALEQHNAAYNNREAFPLADLARRLLLPDAAAAARCAAAHGVALEPEGETPAAARFRAAPFRARTDKGGLPTAALDPPLPPPVDLAEMNAEALLALWMRGAPE